MWSKSQKMLREVDLFNICDNFKGNYTVYLNLDCLRFERIVTKLQMMVCLACIVHSISLHLFALLDFFSAIAKNPFHSS